MSTLAAIVDLDQNSSGWVIALFICGFLVWIFALVSLLKRQDLKDADKIVWVIVLCCLNILGTFLYWFLVPAQPGIKSWTGRSRAMTDKELKEYFNTRDDRPERKD